MSLSDLIEGYLKGQTITYLTRENVDDLRIGITDLVNTYIIEERIAGRLVDTSMMKATPLSAVPNRWVLRCTLPAGVVPTGNYRSMPQMLQVSRCGTPTASDKDRTRTKVCTSEAQAKRLKTQAENCGYTVVIVPSYDSLIEV